MKHIFFQHKITECHDKYFELVRLSRKCAKDKMWITCGIKKVVTRKINYSRSGYVHVMSMMKRSIRIT